MSGEPATGTAPATGLKRTLGFWQVTAGGVGIIIGAGIYVLIGAAAAEAGPMLWAAFALAAVLCTFTGLGYAELASMFPYASAEYEYTKRVFPEWLAFLVGWVMIAGLVVAAAAVSLGFARYLGQFFDLGSRGPALGLLLFVSFIAMTGIKQSAWVVLTLSAIQVGGLLAIIGIGSGHVGDHALTGSATTGGIMGAAALVFFAFIGFDEVTTLSEETRNPTKTIPRALITALTISTTLYVLVAIAAVSVLGATALGESSRPLADVMSEVAGGAAGDVVAAIALVSTTNTTLLALTSASRMIYGMSSHTALPPLFAAVNRRTQTPIRAIISAALVSACFVMVGRLTLVASVTDFAIYLVFLAVNMTVILLRWRQPDAPRPFRVPGPSARLPVVPILGIIAVLVMMTQLEIKAVLLGIGMCILGLGAAWVEAKRRRAYGIEG